MTEYIDTIIMVIPEEKLDTYIEREQFSATVYLKHGALGYSVSVGDDMNPTWADAFPDLATTRMTDSIVITTITYASREQRDSIQDNAMRDESMIAKDMGMEMRFDSEPLIYGGFQTIINEQSSKK